MMKVLYVDTPFDGLQGGDKNRSRFIWSCLAMEFAADLLLVKTAIYTTITVEEHHGYRKLFTLGSMAPQALKPKAIFNFHPIQLRKFKDILIREQYDIIVFRFLSHYHLAKLAEKTLTNCLIVIDVDMLFSRISELAWKQNPNLHNRYNLIEMIKLKKFEAVAFKQDFSFYFTNPVELDMAVSEYGLLPENAHVFPNMMEMDTPPSYSSTQGRYILFFGTMNSVANQDAFRYFVNDIYPSIESQLRRAGVQIWVAGKNPPDFFQKNQDDCIRILGAVEDMQPLIASSEFVILPLRIASGTRTRILEAARVKKAVITTSIGMEGFSFSNKEILQIDKAADFAAAILELVDNQEQRDVLGKNLFHSALSKYGAKPVSEAFIESIRAAYIDKPTRRLKLAIVTNRFYPEVGGAETNIFYQTKALAAHHDVTVFCPKRIERPATETCDGFRVRRMWDVLNRPPQYPNLKSKTLCPILLWELLRGRYDIIQCFPAINYNNILAFIAAKLLNIPYILCFFDFIDYAGYIQAHGKVPKDVLDNTPVKWYQKIILRKMDKAFAISMKELEFLKKFNPNIEFSPVPVDTKEFARKTDKPVLMSTWESVSFVFLCLGRVSHIKGQDIALNAFALAASKMPGARLVFVGRSDYEADFLEGMKEKIQASNISGKVHFTGMVERAEVLAWLHHSDIHVIPVRFMNSGAVVAESWISDTPVIQSDVVDPNLVVEGENGWLFESENVEALADKMILAYNMKDQLPQLAALGKQRVLKTHTYEYLLELYQSAYSELLGR